MPPSKAAVAPYTLLLTLLTLPTTAQTPAIRSFHEYSAQTVPAPRQLPPNVYTNLQPPPASSPSPPPPKATPRASLEFDLAAYDAEGKLITSLSQSIQPAITEAQYQQLLKGPFRFFQQLDLPPGAFFLRIGILDATSTKLGTLEIPLTVPKK